MSDTKPTRLYNGNTFTRDGETYRVTFPQDEIHEEPWNDGDGRGIVTEWLRESPGASFRELCADHGRARYFDYDATLAKAKAEGWDAAPYGGHKTTRAKRAVEAEYELIRGWCHDEWIYVGVVVERLDDDGEPTGDTASVWGIESNADAYLAETAWELASEIVPTAKCETCKGSGRVARKGK